MFQKPVWEGLSFGTWSVRRWSTVVLKGRTWSAAALRWAVVFKWCSGGTKRSKVCQEHPPHTHTHTHTPWPPQQQPDPLIPGRMDPCFMFWPDRLNVAAETHQTRRCSSSLLSSSFGDLQFPVLSWEEPGLVSCCWIPSASSFHVLSLQRRSSADLGCNEELFEGLFPFYHLQPVWPLTSGINKAFSSFWERPL